MTIKLFQYPIYNASYTSKDKTSDSIMKHMDTYLYHYVHDTYYKQAQTVIIEIYAIFETLETSETCK